MKFNQVNTMLRICIGTALDGRFSGVVYSQRLKEPMPFRDASQLLLQIETLLDTQKYPQAFQRARAFSSAKEDFKYAAATPEEGMSAAAVIQAEGSVATLNVNIISRRSSTWQGVIHWYGDDAPIQFSSALEFMRVLDERLFG